MSELFRLRPHFKNMIGKTVPGKYLVLESDDWGSIRMPSKDTFNRLKSVGVNLGLGETARYNLTDTLASAEDFDALFHVLRKFRDNKGNHPVFTAVSVVANPDFDKIKSDHFRNYYFLARSVACVERGAQQFAHRVWVITRWHFADGHPDKRLANPALKRFVATAFHAEFACSLVDHL